MNLWPGLMSLDLAAQYCSMKPVEFKKAVAVGELPQPVLIDGKERWRLVEIERQFEGVRDEWQKSPYPMSRR